MVSFRKLTSIADWIEPSKLASTADLAALMALTKACEF
jgi:hypothetical protein